jgi:hypothetical protein
MPAQLWRQLQQRWSNGSRWLGPWVQQRWQRRGQAQQPCGPLLLRCPAAVEHGRCMATPVRPSKPASSQRAHLLRQLEPLWPGGSSGRAHHTADLVKLIRLHAVQKDRSAAIPVRRQRVEASGGRVLGNRCRVAAAAAAVHSPQPPTPPHPTPPPTATAHL